jgi:hypothetical protein
MDADLRKLLARVAEVRGSREDLAGVARKARRLADAACSGELTKIRREGTIAVRSAESRSLLRERAGKRRCRIRRSAIDRAVTDRRQAIARDAREAKAELRRAELDAGVRSPAVRTPRSKPARKLTRAQIEEAVTEARSELGAVKSTRDYGRPEAALWWFSAARLRAMLHTLKRGHLHDAALESYDDNHEEIHAHYDDAHGGDRATKRRDRDDQEEHERSRSRAAHVLAGAPLATDATKRVLRALVVRNHDPKLSPGGRVRCLICDGRGRFLSAGGRRVFDADSKLRGDCPGEPTDDAGDADDAYDDEGAPF